ncbi:M23 family metallopeptidase [Chitinophaga vietnamensis]|uniref:M23 family metallopeptidase n=1 Tax=Chitinophaga vietnamensis TaxID=2593957 RepID=UPI001178A094|nr:M23 family metallopeptidase [Chitinophaga vietnamensis]
MIIYTLLGITLALALYSLYLIWKAGGRPLSAVLTYLLAGISLGIFLYLYGTWVYLSVFTKYIFGGIFLLLLIRWILIRPVPGTVPPSRRKRFANVTFTILVSVLNLLYFTGTTGSARTVELSFPFHRGQYFVLQGGKGLPTNLFHFSLRGAIYAMDIVKLNTWGGRANKVFSKDLHDYEIFGDTIYAPCDGRVLHAYGGNPDNTPPNMNRGPKNTNHVLLETDRYYVFMGHMKMYSVLVHDGQQVLKGQPLGCVGNSGFSTEPHLHIQAHLKEPGIEWYKSRPLYIHFDGRGFLLNDVINASTR